MVEEDAANVEALLRNMANRLMLMANVLHGMTAQQGAPTAGDDKEMARFFVQGQPFREYKALAKEPNFAERCETAELSIPETGWQKMLLDSARRGEHIVRFNGYRQAMAQVRSSV